MRSEEKANGIAESAIMPGVTENGTRAVIIDSMRGTRHLDNTRSAPSSLKAVESSRTVLDWVLHALSSCGVNHVTYVGGYHIQKVIQRYPNLDYRFQGNWQREGELAGLLLALPADPLECLIIRASTICVPEALRRLVIEAQGVSAGYYANGSEQSFAGLVALPAAQSAQAFEMARTVIEGDPGADLEQWLSVMESDGLPLRSVDLDTLAAPLHDPIAVARTVFGGKGRTLEQVAPLIRSAVVLEQVRFSVADWVNAPAPIIAKVQQTFGRTHVVVRSSAHSEDGLEESAAGRFKSVLDVPAGQKDRLSAGVNEVVSSYTKSGRVAHTMDEVLVQRYVGNLAANGVLLTRDIETGAPYYVLNIDRCSGRSDSVTSGAETSLDTLYVSRTPDSAQLAPDVQACVTLARELEELMHLDALDIEFGIDQAGVIYLFQVRPIARRARKFHLADDDLSEELDQIRDFLDAHLRPHPTLAGDTTVLGTMPDWNPAEMIGTTPRPLALSLYQRLIGDQAWAAARAIIGYRDVRPEPLIISLGGRPYVDVRASLNSFLPCDLDGQTSETWVNYCLRMLHDDPRLHDKIEFDVAITCLTFDFDHHAQRLRRAELSEAAIAAFRERLLRLTDAALTSRVAPIESQLAQLQELACRRQRWLQTPTAGTPGLARLINALLADCERYGLVPFSVLARYAFISMSLLRSLQEVGVFSGEESEALLRSIPTVASELSRDLASHTAGRLSTGAMLERYGHLRPSSYDITSPNYATAWDTYVSNSEGSPAEIVYPDVSVATGIFDAHEVQIGALLRSAGFEATAAHLRDFVLRSIPARERAKFEFMKSVDAALEGIAQLAQELGFSRDEMSFLPVDVVVRGATESVSSAVHKKRWNLTCAIRLPHLVRSATGVAAFQLEEWTPNFISASRVVAPPVALEAGLPVEALEGRIVLTRSADPGFDWIFSHSIAGLITEYGGIASHMAIRAAEFGLPAAIGCGEVIFNRLCSARLIELDCTSKKVRAIS